MIESLKVFVVHYSKLRYRRRYLEKELKKYGFDYEFITKYDKEDINDDLINERYCDDKESYENKTSSLWDKKSGSYRKLSLEEISCTLKHFECIRLSSLREGPSLIIEDDCVFFENFKNNLHDIIKETESNNVNWDAIFLGLGCGDHFQKQYISNNSVQISQKLFKIGHPATNCAECYLVNQDSSTRIIKDCYPFNMISDWEMAYLFKKLNMDIYWSIPSLAWQGSKDGKFVSTLDYGQR